MKITTTEFWESVAAAMIDAAVEADVSNEMADAAIKVCLTEAMDALHRTSLSAEQIAEGKRAIQELASDNISQPDADAARPVSAIQGGQTMSFRQKLGEEMRAQIKAETIEDAIMAPVRSPDHNTCMRYGMGYETGHIHGIQQKCDAIRSLMNDVPE